MKRILLAVLIAAAAFESGAQSTYSFPFDTVRFKKPSGNAEVAIENATRGRTGAFLRNWGNGRTEFAYALDSVYFSGDSLYGVRGDGTYLIGVVGGGDSASAGISYTFNPPFNLAGSVVSLPGWNAARWDSTYDWWKSNPLSLYYPSSTINGIFSGAISKTGYNKANWDSAYTWASIFHTNTYLTRAVGDSLYAPTTLIFTDGLGKSGTNVVAKYSQPMWHANRIQGYYVDASQPCNGCTFKFDSAYGRWTFGPAAEVAEVDLSNYYTKPESDARYLQSFTEADATALAALVDTAAAIRGSMAGGGGSGGVNTTIIPASVNDNVENAIKIMGGGGTLIGDNTGATHQSIDPDGENTVWFLYNAVADGVLNVSTAGSSFDSRIYIGTWDGSSFTSLASNDDYGATVQSSVSISVVASQAYWICVSGYGATDLGQYYLNYTSVVLDLSNYLTLSDNQTITGLKTFTVPIVMRGASISFTDPATSNTISLIYETSITGNYSLYLPNRYGTIATLDLRTPSSDTDSSLGVGGFLADENYLYFKTPSGVIKKIAWTPF